MRTSQTRDGSRRQSLIGGTDPWLWILLPTLVVLGLIFGLPLAGLISVSFHEMTGPAQMSDHLTLGSYEEFFGDPFFLGLMLQTFKLGIAASSSLIPLPISLRAPRRAGATWPCFWSLRRC
jgi:ABC-type spermidine/putrescine transport system permease subunit I